GSALINNEPSYDLYWGSTNFYETASAGTATIVNEAAVIETDNDAGSTWFNDSSSAGSATIVNQGTSSPDGAGGVVYFWDDSTAADSTITCEASTGGSYNSAAIWFNDESDGGRSRIILNGDARLFTYLRTPTSLYTKTVGSLEGDGRVVVSAS